MSQTRVFRPPESIEAEEGRRAALKPFLKVRGYTELFDERKQYGTAQTQIIRAMSPSGEAISMRVRLCWRRGGRTANEHQFSAAQLRAKLMDNDWAATPGDIRERDLVAGVTHTLFVREDRSGRVVLAALVPRDELKGIWTRQRDIAEEPIRTGQSGTVKANQL
jgi:5-methylcytosine-specific restriction protein A